MYDYGTGFFGMHGGMGFFWLVPLLVIFALVYMVNGNKRDDLSARDILDKRYASGEIDEEEYKQKRDELKK